MPKDLTEYARKRYRNTVKTSLNYIYKLWLIVKEVRHNSSILELGCGDGVLTEMLRKHNKVIAIDLEKGDIHHDLQNGLPPNLQDGKFDYVIASELIEHIWDNGLLLQHMSKALKPHGKIILSTPNLASLGRRIMLLFGKNPHVENFLYFNEAGHVKHYTFKDFKYLLEKNGFIVEKLYGDVIMLSNNGKLWSKGLAKLFPKLSRCIIAVCRKS